MRKWIPMVLAALFVVSGAAWAGQTKKVHMMNGFLLDTTSAKASAADLGELCRTQTKENVLQSGAKNGYCLYTAEGKLLPFTKKSKEVIATFLHKPENGLQVQASVKKVGKYLEAVSFQNQR